VPRGRKEGRKEGRKQGYVFGITDIMLKTEKALYILSVRMIHSNNN
jgi:hypothetical protein